jgi:hypothetical protein
MKKIFAVILLSTCLLTSSGPFSHFLSTLRTAAKANRPSLGVKTRRNAKKYRGHLVSSLTVLGFLGITTLAAEKEGRQFVRLLDDKALQYVVASLSS